MIEKRIFPLLKRHAGYVWLLLAAVTTKSLISFVTPVAVREMLEAVSLPAPSPDSLAFYAAVFAGCFALGYLVNIGVNHLYLRFSFRFKLLFSAELYEQLFRLEYKAFQSKESAYYVSRIKQFIDQAFSLAADSLPSGVVSVITAAVALGFIWSISPWLFALAALLLPLNFYGYRALNRRLKEKSAAFQEIYADNFKNILGVAQNIEAIKQLNNYPFFSSYVGKYVESMEREANSISYFARNASMLVMFMADVLRNAILLGSIFLLYSRKISFPEVMFVTMIMNIYFSSLADMTHITLGMRDVRAGFDFLERELQAQAEREGREELSPVRGLSLKMGAFSYDGKKEVIKDFSLELGPGDSVAVVGRSGCGKSTLGKLLTRLYNSDEVVLNGRPAPEYSLRSLRRRIYHVAQTPQLFPGTIADNITAGLDAPDKRRYEEVVAMPFMKDLRETHDGLAFVVKDGGSNLSGGQKQRITLARMLMHDPDIVLLDESTSALDGAAEESLISSVRELCRGKILIYVSHRLSTVRQADRIVVMKGGRVDAAGAYSELKERAGEFRDIFAAQM